jgi:hypothetical protein
VSVVALEYEGACKETAYAEKVCGLTGPLFGRFIGVLCIGRTPSSSVVSSNGVFDFDDFGAE